MFLLLSDQPGTVHRTTICNISYATIINCENVIVYMHDLLIEKLELWILIENLASY